MVGRNTNTPHRSQEQLGAYYLLRTLGLGGFGKVYLGEHIHLHSRAAVKVLHAALVNEQAEQFKHEAQTVAQLDPHPHIVRVLDYNVQNGRPYIVMDYAPHGTLRQRHTFGEMVPLPTVVSYANQLASGLQHAHNAGVAHCDVKPENMFLDSQDQVLIGDFGIAVGLQEENPQSEDTFGTVPYMAPEQIQSHPQPASDQYALAVSVYEWLTGQLPFTGSDKLEIANKHLHDQPQSMHAINPDIPKAVERVVMKALNKNPRRRYPNITAFAQALDTASQPRHPRLAQRAFGVVRSRVFYSARPQWRISRSISLLSLIPLILLGILALAYWVFPVATVTITETGLAQTWEDSIFAIIGDNDSSQNPVDAHIETVVTPSQKNKVSATGEQHVQATQAHGEVTFYNADIVAHLVPVGTIIAVPNSTLQVMIDETVTLPASDLSQAGQGSAQAHIVQAGAAGNIAAQALYGTTCCSSDNIRVDNLEAFNGGEDDHTYSIVQQSDIDDAAKPLEASQVQNGSTVLQEQAQPYEAFVASSVQCVPTVSPDAAVGSRATSVTVTVMSICSGAFYNAEFLKSVVIPRFMDYEDQRLGSAYALVGSVKINVTKAILLPAKNNPARLVLHVVATGVWLFNFNGKQKQRLLKAITGKGRREARAQLIQIIYKPGVNMVNIQFAWNIPRFTDDGLPFDINRIRLEVVQK